VGEKFCWGNFVWNGWISEGVETGLVSVIENDRDSGIF